VYVHIVLCFISSLGVGFPRVYDFLDISALPIAFSLLSYIILPGCHKNVIGKSPHFVVFTKAFMEVKDVIKSCTDIALKGPEGCGKSFIATILFFTLQEKKPFLYFGLKSLVDPSVRSYLFGFLEQYSKKVKAFLSNNLNLIETSKPVGEFLEKQNWMTNEKYINYTYRGKEMTDDEYHEYHFTWMYSNEVTIETGKHTVKFNFPDLGIIVLQIFQKNARQITTIQELAVKQRSVAEFLFEEEFYAHCQNENKLLLSCIDLEKKLYHP